MKLSEAIRLGAMLQPKRNGSQGMYWDKGKGTCALGAAAQAVGLDITSVSVYTPIWDLWPFTERLVAHPINGLRNMVSSTIWELNDHYDWTRERIADWVATIEPQEVAAPIEAPQHQEAAS